MNAPRNYKHTIYLSLGSNIEPEKNIPKAIDLLAGKVHVVAISNAWKTPAVGSLGPDFLNAVIQINTDLDPNTLKTEILYPIESQLDRVRTSDKNAPRTIDLDILIVDDIIVDDEIWFRVYLAVPLAELEGELIHTRSGQTIAEIAQLLKETNAIQLQPHLFGVENRSDHEVS